MDSHVVVGGVGEGCKWAKSSQTLGTLWRVYFKPRVHECLYEVRKKKKKKKNDSPLNAQTGKKYRRKSRLVLNL